MKSAFIPVLKLNVPTPGIVLSSAAPTLIDSELLFGCNASAETVNCVILFFIGFNATPILKINGSSQSEGLNCPGTSP